MRAVGALLAMAAAALPACLPAASLSEYVDSAVCASCHREIYQSYRQTGMGRSFARASIADLPIPAAYYHAPSDQHFAMVRRGERIYQRRYQAGPDGRETNVVEKAIDYILGSGDHARTYVHRTGEGRLIELPLAWYSENGGTWAMNPGYDRPDHMDFRRKLDRECLFCHNAYPKTESGQDPEIVYRGAVPEGIDCQRCHGPGARHVAQASAGQSVASIRAAIVNPARLAPDRRNEVCFQCHLESTSQRLPYSVRQYGRSFFSYVPGEALAGYILHFDHAPGTGHEDKFEIDHAAYRMLKSACYRESNGALTCTTCHDPHRQPRGEEATRKYDQACSGCHSAGQMAGALPATHPELDAASSCVKCHMIRRRTEDVVHVVMTDHLIERSPRKYGATAPLRERQEQAGTAYRGPVVPLYPPSFRPGPVADLYPALAQVLHAANDGVGIPALQAAIKKWKPQQAEFYFELANALSRAGDAASAFDQFEEALRRKPDYLPARANYAQALLESGRAADAVRLLEAAKMPDAATLNTLGTAYLALGSAERSAAILRRAIQLDPDLPEAQINLGNALTRVGDTAGAIAALEAAVRLQPGSAAAHTNLGSLLSAQRDFDNASAHFDRAIRTAPDSLAARYNFGLMLLAQKRYGDAEVQLRAALQAKPHHTEAAVALGLVFMQTGRPLEAIELYRDAIHSKPELTAARYNLALALLSTGDRTEAIEELRLVVRTAPQDYEAHLRLGQALLAAGHREEALAHLHAASASSNASVRVAAQEALRIPAPGR